MILLGGPPLPQMHRLSEPAVAGRIPDGETNPFLPGGIERNSELPASERSQIRGGDHLPAGCLTVSPHNLDEFERKRPFDLGAENSVCPRALDAVLAEQHLSARDEEIPGAHGPQNR